MLNLVSFLFCYRSTGQIRAERDWLRLSLLHDIEWEHTQFGTDDDFPYFFGYSLVGKMIVAEVAMIDPPAVFVTVLVFSPPPELPKDECCQSVENALRANAFVIVRPSPDNSVQYPY